MSMNPWRLVLVSLALAVWFDVLFFKSYGLGLNVFLFELTMLITLLWLTQRRPGIHLENRHWISASFALAFSATFFIWTSPIGLTLSGIGLIIANIALLLSLFAQEMNHRHPLQWIRHTCVRCSDAVRGLSILSQCRFPKTTERSNAVIRGLLVALPILVVFALLFIGSDLILQRNSFVMVERLFEVISMTEESFVAQMVIVFCVALASLGVLSALFHADIRPLVGKAHMPKLHTESLVVLVGLHVIFVLFLAFQSYYLFGGQAAWNAIDGITYAEYAVQGFNQLAVVAALVLFLVLTLRFFHGERTTQAIKWLEVGLLAETILVLLSAWVRMSLYVEQYGYTPARLFGYFFFLTMALVLVVFAIHIFRSRHQAHFMKEVLVVFGSAALVFTALAPDALSVRLNIVRAEQMNEPIDAYPLFEQLTPEAYPMMEYVLRELNHNLTSRDVDDLVDDWNTERCLRVNDRGERVRYDGSGKGMIYYRDSVTWRNWNFARAKMPVCTRTPRWSDRRLSPT